MDLSFNRRCCGNAFQICAVGRDLSSVWDCFSLRHGTFTVNVLGCFLIGILVVLAEEKFLLNPQLRLMLMVGFCGAFTTFSTFILETANLTKQGEILNAFLNILLSVAL